MKYEFRPYAKMQPTIVTLTGKVYEKGEHPLYAEYKIIEVVDEEGEIHYAFEDELRSDGVEKPKKVYSEEEVIEHLNLLYSMKNSMVDTFTNDDDYITMKWFEQFKKK